MPGFSSLDYAHSTILLGTAALNCAKGIVGGAAGARVDTLLLGVLILKNAGPATLTITGLQNSSGNAASLILNGSTADDRLYLPPFPLLNELAAFTFQPSVASTVVVFTRAYAGP